VSACCYQELVENLISIAASFAGKLHGMRSREKGLTESLRKLLEGAERNG